MDLRLLGYSYPVKTKFFGARVELLDANNRMIMTPQATWVGIDGQKKMENILSTIAELLNSDFENRFKQDHVSTGQTFGLHKIPGVTTSADIKERRDRIQSVEKIKEEASIKAEQDRISNVRNSKINGDATPSNLLSRFPGAVLAKDIRAKLTQTNINSLTVPNDGANEEGYSNEEKTETKDEVLTEKKGNGRGRPRKK